MSNTQTQTDILTRLRDDHDYYGDFGRQFLSNSDIGTLLKNPKAFGVKREDSSTLAIGRYFHQCLLEPDKAKEVKSIDVASRNTKIYKEAIKESDHTVILLQKEMDHVDELVSRMKSNFQFFEGIYEDGNKFEVPAITNILGVPFKGKADIVTDNCLIDLKTTSDIYKFKYSAYSYNYDSQAYIYQLLFGKPLKFYVIDKQTMLMGKFEPSPEFVERGKYKVHEAIKVYNRFFSDQSEEDVQDYFIQEVL